MACPEVRKDTVPIQTLPLFLLLWVISLTLGGCLKWTPNLRRRFKLLS